MLANESIRTPALAGISASIVAFCKKISNLSNFKSKRFDAKQDVEQKKRWQKASIIY